jgi:hypothetical protein
MADISMCNGQNCPVKEKCYRFTAPKGFRQTYFAETPGKNQGDDFFCNMYWGENAESIWMPLKNITNEQLET